MVDIAASYQCSYRFPADIDSAFNFYREPGRVFQFLPYISLVRVHSGNQFRMLYKSDELGFYQVRIYCDLETIADENTHLLSIRPSNNNIQPVACVAGFSSLRGQGYYASHSQFVSENAHTRIEFSLELKSSLPVPLGLRLMSNNTIRALATSITQQRVQEIAERFIKDSVDYYKNQQVKP